MPKYKTGDARCLGLECRDGRAHNHRQVVNRPFELLLAHSLHYRHKAVEREGDGQEIPSLSYFMHGYLTSLNEIRLIGQKVCPDKGC